MYIILLLYIYICIIIISTGCTTYRCTILIIPHPIRKRRQTPGASLKRRSYFAEDGIHPNQRGRRQMGPPETSDTSSGYSWDMAVAELTMVYGIEIMDWFRGNLQESPIFYRKNNGFLYIFPSTNPLILSTWCLIPRILGRLVHPSYKWTNPTYPTEKARDITCLGFVGWSTKYGLWIQQTSIHGVYKPTSNCRTPSCTYTQ